MRALLVTRMQVLLGSLAHNVVVWARQWLTSPHIQRYGILRLVRDVFHISGLLRLMPLLMSLRLF